MKINEKKKCQHSTIFFASTLQFLTIDDDDDDNVCAQFTMHVFVYIYYSIVLGV